MNAKLAKALRRKARKLTVEMPAMDYHRDRLGTFKVSARSTRGCYLIAKKHVAKARRFA